MSIALKKRANKNNIAPIEQLRLKYKQVNLSKF